MIIRSISNRIDNIKNNFINNDGWGNIDTHYAFAMKFEVNLVIISALNRGIKKYCFSYQGPYYDNFGEKKTKYGIFFGNNHYQLLDM